LRRCALIRAWSNVLPVVVGGVVYLANIFMRVSDPVTKDRHGAKNKMKFNLDEKEFRKYFTIIAVAFAFIIIITAIYYLSAMFPSSTNYDEETDDKIYLNNKADTVETQILEVFNSSLQPVSWNATLGLNETLIFTFDGRSINNTGDNIVDGFNCRTDMDESSPCKSPIKVKNVDLGVGQHTFEVFAEDNEGNDDPSPAVFLWSVR